MDQLDRKPFSYWTGGEEYDYRNPNILEDRLGELSKIVLEVVDGGLTPGMGVSKPGKMCVEAAVCYALGLPHNDNPPCVSHALRNLKISVNDCDWSSRMARARGMRRIAIAQLGTRGKIKDKELIEKIEDLVVPAALAKMAELSLAGCRDLSEDELKKAKDLIEELRSGEVRELPKIFSEFRGTAKRGNYNFYLDSAQDSLSLIFANRSADIDSSGGHTVNIVEALGRCGSPYEDFRMDKVLTEFNESVITVLREMGAPAIKYMDELAPLPNG